METTNQPTEQPINVAAIMAKEGKLNLNGDLTPTKIANQEPESTPEPAKVADAAPTTEPEKTVTPEAKPEPAQQEQPDWRTVLKNQSHVEVLRELGADDDTVSLFEDLKSFDPKVKNLLKSYKQGDVKSYLKALDTDYSKMSPEDIMMHDIRDTYPELSEESLREVYNDRVLDKYKIDPNLYDEKEVKRGKALLEVDSIDARKRLEEKRQKFLLPDAPPQPVDDSADKLKAFVDDYRRKPEIVDFINKKKLTLGEGDDAFNLEITNPEDNLKTLLDIPTWNEKFGKADISTQLLIAAILNDKSGIFKSYANHFKSLGKREIINVHENPSGPAAQPSPNKIGDYKSPAEAMAREGRFTYS